MMISTPDGLYVLSYTTTGFCECANDATTGATVWINGSDAYTAETNPLTAQFLEMGYDLSDRPDLAEPIILPPDWAGFRLNMIQDGAYQRVTAAASATTTGNLAVQRLEISISVTDPQPNVIAVLWAVFMNEVPEADRPNADEVYQWSVIAANNNMPFRFDPETCQMAVSS